MAIYWYFYMHVNLSPRVRKKTAKIFTKKTTDSCIVLSVEKQIYLGYYKTLVLHEVFSNLRFLIIDIDVVNNNESNQKQNPPFCCMFHAQTSLYLVKLGC